jgi:hypothetical protein
MPVRAAGGHHQAVGDGGFALEIDKYDVLRLVVVQTGQDQVLQRADATGRVFGRPGFPFGGGAFLRTRRTFTGQRGCSFECLAEVTLA